MAGVDLKGLLGLLNPTCRKALEMAAGNCVNRGHYDVTSEHLLQALLEHPDADAPRVASNTFGGDPARLVKAILPALEQMQTGNTGRPVFSPHMIRWFERAWMLASIDFGLAEIRSGILMLALMENPARYLVGDHIELIETMSADELRRNFVRIVGDSKETSRKAGSAAGGSARPDEAAGGSPDMSNADSALARYAMNFTERAREDGIDPVFGRDREIRQMVDILARRRKNNPIVVGEAGVGKTALVEGLAVRIVAGDVPAVLHDVELIGLDLGLLQAGAGIKGEFENRLRQVIDEVKSSPIPIILFIDEAHTMIGAGGKQGGGDAANLLKPALARGELRTIAATTWSEYKKYFEKDAALSRRFQLVKLDEPGVDATATMLRGLRGRYEEAHGVVIRDDALVAAAELGARYISGRQHPDKGIDLVDTAAARVRVASKAKPAELEDAERSIARLQREQAGLERDAEHCAVPVEERLEELVVEIEATEVERERIQGAWEAQRAAADKVLEVRERLTDGQVEARADLEPVLDALYALQGNEPLVPIEVTPEVVGRVVSDWTGVPLGKMVRDAAASLLTLEDDLEERIKGQDHALAAIGTAIRSSKAGLKNPKTPTGVFLFVGPSGVGKTEAALGVADQIFGGERFLTTINMSEFQEKHTVSRLIGSPPGYVGYGEGGVLTEAVRQRPYSAVLLDEVEKAHPEVLNLFYQVFDKGMLADGEGRVIDFKDTILFLTSNLASDLIVEACEGGEVPDPEELTELIRPVLSDYFKPALLGRMTIVPFYTIDQEVMTQITRLKLGHLGERLMASHKMTLNLDDMVVYTIAERCTTTETGARNIDHIINATLLPRLSKKILEEMAAGPLPDAIRMGIDAGGEFTFTFE